MSETDYAVTARLWRWSMGDKGGDWFFISVGDEVGEALSATALMHRMETGRPSGWGAVKIAVTVGETCWRTSAFPSKERGWMVPIKAVVRKAEGLIEDEPFALTLTF